MSKTVLPITVLAAALAAATPGVPWLTAPVAYAQAANPWAGVTATSLTDAITAIEQTTGGKVLEIRFRIDSGVIGYDAVVARGVEISHVRVGAAPALRVAVVAETDVPVWEAGFTLAAYARTIETAGREAKLTLADAVRKAEMMVGGVAVDAGLAKPLNGGNTVLAYNVEVIRNGRPQRVVIDARTGLQIANPETLLDTWSPEEALSKTLGRS